MIKLDKSLRAWGTPGFEAIFKQELAQQAGQLPLQQGLSAGNYVVAEAPVTVAIISVVELENVIRVKAGIFYRSVMAGCSCADDPTPISENNEYCEVQMDIDKASAGTTIALITEQAG